MINSVSPGIKAWKSNSGRMSLLIARSRKAIITWLRTARPTCSTIRHWTGRVRSTGLFPATRLVRKEPALHMASKARNRTPTITISAIKTEMLMPARKAVTQRTMSKKPLARSKWSMQWLLPNSNTTVSRRKKTLVRPFLKLLPSHTQSTRREAMDLRNNYSREKLI